MGGDLPASSAQPPDGARAASGAALLPAIDGLTVLDAGCGTGRYLLALGGRGAKALGVDLSMPMLARARAAGSRIARADVCALPIERCRSTWSCARWCSATSPISRWHCRNWRACFDPAAPSCIRSCIPQAPKPDGGATFDAPAGSWRSRAFGTPLTIIARRCAAAGLHVTAWAEPVLHEAPDHPAVLVMRASR